MSKYQENFTFDILELDIIEEALRTQAELESRSSNAGDGQKIQPTTAKAKQIQELLGKIHNQKKFYANVSKEFHPGG